MRTRRVVAAVLIALGLVTAASAAPPKDAIVIGLLAEPVTMDPPQITDLNSARGGVRGGRDADDALQTVRLEPEAAHGPNPFTRHCRKLPSASLAIRSEGKFRPPPTAGSLKRRWSSTASSSRHGRKSSRSVSTDVMRSADGKRSPALEVGRLAHPALDRGRRGALGARRTARETYGPTLVSNTSVRLVVLPLFTRT